MVTRRTVAVAGLTLVASAAALAVRGSGVAPREAVLVADTPADVPDGTPAASTSPASVSPSGQSGRRPTGRPAPAPARPELPRGGRVLFPAYRVVAYAGLPGAPALGRLGIGDLDDRTAELERTARLLAGRGRLERRPLPALELIAVVAQSAPGDDGRYRVRVDPDVVDVHLAAARRRRALLLLNIQPGRAGFLDEVKAFERWLREPDVGLALDPEWAVRAGQRPGQVFGSVTGRTLDGVSGWLADLVAEHDLPEKLLVVHVLTPSVLRDVGALRRRAGVRVVSSADGIGSPAAKVQSWRAVQRGAVPPGAPEADRGSGVLRAGFKLFLVEDARGSSRVMRPAEVLALEPAPDYVCYE